MTQRGPDEIGAQMGIRGLANDGMVTNNSKANSSRQRSLPHSFRYRVQRRNV